MKNTPLSQIHLYIYYISLVVSEKNLLYRQPFYVLLRCLDPTSLKNDEVVKQYIFISAGFLCMLSIISFFPYYMINLKFSQGNCLNCEELCGEKLWVVCVLMSTLLNIIPQMVLYD